MPANEERKDLIMIVEDSPTYALATKAIVWKGGYDSVIVESGEEAIALLDKTERLPVLVLMDVNLRGTLTGIETAEYILANHDVPVVFLTASEHHDQLERIRRSGASAYIQKPVQLKELILTIDLTLYKHRTARAIREREAFFSSMLNGISDAVAGTDAEMNIKFFNPAAEALLGITADDAIGRALPAVLHTNNPELNSALGTLTPQKLAEQWDMRWFETVITAADGREFAAEININPSYDNTGVAVGMVVAFRDVTTRREAAEALQKSEANLRAIFESSLQGFLLLDTDGTIRAFNKVAAEGTRTLFAEEMRVGQHAGKHLDVYLQQAFAHNFSRALNGESVWSEWSKEGSWFESYYGPVFAPDNSVIGVSMAIRDITSKKEADRLLLESNRQLTEAYSIISKDIQAAALVQQSLLPRNRVRIENVAFEWMLHPYKEVAGDIFNYFLIDEHHVGFYLLDVAGHGIPSAMLSVMISKILTPVSSQSTLLWRFTPDPPRYEVRSPSSVMSELNQTFQTEHEAMQYFTMVYGIIDRRTNTLTISQGGHPSPVLLRADGTALTIGDGGFPVGMLPDIVYEEQTVHLQPGDRLFLYSDGITECENSAEQPFTEERLLHLLQQHRNGSLEGTLQAVERAIGEWRGNNDFEDDITLLAVELH